MGYFAVRDTKAMSISGIGRLTDITVRVGSPSTISKRGTSMIPGSVTSKKTKGVIGQRNVHRYDEDIGGSRQVAVFDFFVEENTIMHPNELADYPVEVDYKGLVYRVDTVIDWPGSHQQLTGDVPESR